MLSVTGRDHRARSPAMSAAHAAVLVGLVRLWHAHIGDRTRAEHSPHIDVAQVNPAIIISEVRMRAEITGRDHLGRAEITGRDHLGGAEITRAEIIEGRDHRTPGPHPSFPPLNICSQGITCIIQNRVAKSYIKLTNYYRVAAQF